MEKISFDCIDIKNGFWADRLKTVSEVSVYNVYKRFKETGRFDALACSWKEGEPNEPHIFWDSDIAKWIESVAFIVAKKRNEELEAVADSAIDVIAQNQLEDGYYNCCYITKHLEKRWTDRTDHELYCLGHYIEAAVAYYNATGKDKLLTVVKKYIDYVIKVFVEEKSAGFVTPGHEEIELALIKLYNLTKDEKYLDLCRFFIDNRGVREEEVYRGLSAKYNQSHLPVREQKTAEGHSVRAGYLYMAMAELGYIDSDNELLDACREIFDDIVNKKMYITGGIGSSERGEAFTLPYDLPNLTAYSESCAALALAWFAQRMMLSDIDSKYADTIERIIYNNGLSSFSLDGKSFFYVNPLEIRTSLLNRNTSHVDTKEHLPITERKEVFWCSCCPPNITRFIASIGDFIYTKNEDTLFVHQFISSKMSSNGISCDIETTFPNDGTVKLSVSGVKNVAIRIPFWCKEYSLSLNGKDVEPVIKNGYAYIENIDSAEIILKLKIDVRKVYPHSAIEDDAQMLAIMRGPVVYCAEAVDNNFNLKGFRFDSTDAFTTEFNSLTGTYDVIATGTIVKNDGALYSFEKPERLNAELKMIPYFAFANRGESDLEVFFLYE